MAQKIIGRQKEQQELWDLYNSGRPELVVVQGRRRVGKTYLVRELFDSKMTFYLQVYHLQNFLLKKAVCKKCNLQVFIHHS